MQTKHWILIRGLLSESFHWWNFLPQIRQALPDHEFHTVDMLGNGRFHQELTPWTVSENIAALQAQFPAVEKFNFLGFSLGGMLALEWAHRFPQKTGGVVVLNGSTVRSPFYRRLQPSALRPMFRSALQKDNIQREQIVLRMTTTMNEERVAEMAQHWGRRNSEYPVRTINFFRQVLLAGKLPYRSLPPSPVLLLSGKNDRVVHPSCSQKLSEDWQVRHEQHPTAGHDLTLDDPAWVIEKMTEFIRQQVL